MKIRLTFTEMMLGTANNNPAIHEEFIASNAPDAASREEEIATIGIDEVVKKDMTVLYRDDGKPIIWDYQVKGFLKAACGFLNRVPDTKSSKLKAFRKVIDGLVHIFPRKLFLNIPEGTTIGNLQRPIRVSTAQGERVALANSETAPAGTWVECEIRALNEALYPTVREWLDYGQYSGIGQWRNAAYGRFSWKELK
jgi:hypothetical protein